MSALALAACEKPRESCGDISQPPAAFDHAPGGAMFIREAAPGDLTTTCTGLGLSENVAACSQGALIVLPALSDSVSYSRQDCLLRHEWGHLNGADANHIGWVRT